LSVSVSVNRNIPESNHFTETGHCGRSAVGCAAPEAQRFMGAVYRGAGGAPPHARPGPGRQGNGQALQGVCGAGESNRHFLTGLL